MVRALSPEIELLKTSFVRFTNEVTEDTIQQILPGVQWSPAKAMRALCFTLNKPYKTLRLERAEGDETSLSFSHITITGIMKDKEPDLHYDLKDYAVTQQSSYFPHKTNSDQALEGPLFSLNVHTEKEANPFWQVSFAKAVEAKHVFLYLRDDYQGINHSDIQVIAIDADGNEDIVFRNFRGDFFAPQLNELLMDAHEAIVGLRGFVLPDQLETYDGLCGKAAKDIASMLDTAGDEVGARQTALAQKLIQLVGLTLNEHKDFGTKQEDGYKFAFQRSAAKFLRVRAYGALPTSLGGVMLTDSQEPEKPLPTFAGKKTKFYYKTNASNEPDYFALGLRTDISTRIMPLCGEDEDAVEFDGIHIWNINQMMCANSLFLDFAISDDRKTWQTVHRKGFEYKLAHDVLALASALETGMMSTEYAHVYAKLITIFRRVNMVKPLSKLTRDDEKVKAEVFKGANSVYAPNRFASPLRLGKHGLHVPIGFRDQKVTMKHLSTLRDQIRSLGYTPMFMYGTLLGAIREKDFIPHDDDLDLAIILEGVHPDKLLEETDRLLAEFQAAEIKATRGPAHAPMIYCRRPPLTIDIFILAEYEGKIYWPHTSLKIKEERADIFLPAGEIEFKGEIFDAPNDPEAVTEARYGADWRIPNAAFEWLV